MCFAGQPCTRQSSAIFLCMSDAKASVIQMLHNCLPFSVNFHVIVCNCSSFFQKFGNVGQLVSLAYECIGYFRHGFALCQLCSNFVQSLPCQAWNHGRQLTISFLYHNLRMAKTGMRWLWLRDVSSSFCSVFTVQDRYRTYILIKIWYLVLFAFSFSSLFTTTKPEAQCRGIASAEHRKSWRCWTRLSWRSPVCLGSSFIG